jgi:hypothetical protein
MHIECADKTHYIVMHCSCDPHDPKMTHRHVYCFADLIEPPPRSRLRPGNRRTMSNTQFIYVSSPRSGKADAPTMLSAPSSSFETQVRLVAPPNTRNPSWKSLEMESQSINPGESGQCRAYLLFPTSAHILIFE